MDDEIPLDGQSPPEPTIQDLAAQAETLESQLLGVIRLMQRQTGPRRGLDADGRWLAIAATHVEQGVMALNRAVYRRAYYVNPTEEPQHG